MSTYGGTGILWTVVRLRSAATRALIVATALLALGFIGAAQAQDLTEGPNPPGATFNTVSFGTVAWTTPENAAASDNAYAQAAPGGGDTNYLHADNFGFTIPSPAVIKGIEVNIEKRSVAGTIVDSRVRIVKGGAVGATDKANLAFWPMADTIFTYGGPADLWGETWTPGDINANNFGVVLSATDSLDTALVDSFTMTIYFTLCPAAPQGTCRNATKSLFIVKDKSDNTKDKLIWKWIKGAATSQAEFANPTSTALYAMCIYENGALSNGLVVPPSASLWKTISTKGYKYKDTNGTEAGVQKIVLKGSTEMKAKALLKGKGNNLPELALGLTLPVVVQLVNSDTGVCFQGTYAMPDVKKNDTEQFKAKEIN